MSQPTLSNATKAASLPLSHSTDNCKHHIASRHNSTLVYCVLEGDLILQCERELQKFCCPAVCLPFFKNLIELAL